MKSNIKNITKSNTNFAPTFDHNTPPGFDFNGHCLLKNDISITKKVINLYISYTVGPQLRNWNTYFALGKCYS